MEPGKARLEAFSDGVIAIIITIMVIELHLPEAFAKGFDAAAGREFLPTLGAYALSFVVVGIMWMNHHYLLHGLPRVTPSVLSRNLLLLFFISLVPPSTGFLGEHPGSSNAAAIYSGVLFTCGVAFSLLQRRIAWESRASGELTSLHQRINLKYLVGLSAYGAAAILAFVSPLISWAIVVGVALLFLVPERPKDGAEQALPELA